MIIFIREVCISQGLSEKDANSERVSTEFNEETIFMLEKLKRINK